MTIIPLKIDTDDGEIKRFQDGDKLSVEEEMEYNRHLIRKLVFILMATGIPITDEELINEVSKL